MVSKSCPKSGAPESAPDIWAYSHLKVCEILEGVLNMKLLRRCGSLLTFFAALLFFTLGQTSTASATYLVGYLPDYGGNFSTFAQTINFSKMTAINICFVNPPTCNGTCTGGSNM